MPKKIYIAQEELNSDEEYILFDYAQGMSKFYIGPSDMKDYVNETKEFLFNFICEHTLFPVFLTFEPYVDVIEEIENICVKECIQYNLTFEKSKKENIAVFTALINDTYTLGLILEETFWIGSSNQFYAISLSDNIKYRLVNRKGVFGDEKPYILPCFDMKGTATNFKLWYDGQGVHVYTNEARFSTVSSLKSYFPKNTIIEK